MKETLLLMHTTQKVQAHLIAGPCEKKSPKKQHLVLTTPSCYLNVIKTLNNKSICFLELEHL